MTCLATPTVIPTLTSPATAPVIAAFGFTGRNAGQAQGADGRGNERRDAEAGSLTPGHGLRGNGRGLFFTYPRILS